MAKKANGKEQGPKGGVKHRPGRGHDRKSARRKKQRFARKAAQKRIESELLAAQQWSEWDNLSSDVKRLLGRAGEPKLPRPGNDQ